MPSDRNGTTFGQSVISVISVTVRARFFGNIPGSIGKFGRKGKVVISTTKRNYLQYM